MQRNGDLIMKVKAGKLFRNISKARDYFRLGKENWEKLGKGESVDIEPPDELVQKNYLIKIKKEKENK